MRDAALESVAVGFFDGVHLGHQAILGRASRALTFGNHPLSVLAPERAPRLIMTPEEKVAAIRACGVGEVEVVDFTPELAALSPEEFAARHFVGLDGSRRSVVCGENWRFGAGGRGDADFLRRLGFDVEVVPYAVFDGERVSSSRIRRSLADGDIAAVRNDVSMLRSDITNSYRAVIDKLDEIDKRSEDRAIALNRRMDPLIEKVAANSEAVDFIKKAAINATVGGKK